MDHQAGDVHGDSTLKEEEDQNQGLDLETAARHQCRGQCGRRLPAVRKDVR